MEKACLRRRMLDVRDAVPAEDRRRWSGEIRGKVLCHPWYRQARTVFSYASFRSEVETEELNRSILSDGKELYLPKTIAVGGNKPYNGLQRKHMIFYRVRDLAELTGGYQGIPEPREKEAFEPGQSGVLMLMPGTAYDEKGNRMGYGGGFYDRYLAERGQEVAHTILLAYAVQRTEKIPVDETDYRPELVITNIF